MARSRTAPKNVSAPPAAPTAEVVDIAVGRRIRQIRKTKGMSLETVAAAASLSIGFLSQIERGISSPTLRALTSLADALQINLASLIDPAPAPAEARPVVVRSAKRAKLTLWKSGIQKQVLAGSSASARFTYCLLMLAPGAVSAEESYGHDGEEAGLIIEGRLKLVVGDQSWALVPGDSFHFDSTRPHRYENLADERTVVAILNLKDSPSSG